MPMGNIEPGVSSSLRVEDTDNNAAPVNADKGR